MSVQLKKQSTYKFYRLAFVRKKTSYMDRCEGTDWVGCDGSHSVGGVRTQQWFQVWGEQSGIVSMELHQVRTASVIAKNFFSAQDVAVCDNCNGCWGLPIFFFSPC